MKTKQTAQLVIWGPCALIWLSLVCALETAVYADVITVTNTNDSGPGSLRQALADVNDGDTINFAISGTIALTSAELVIDKSVTISAQPGSITVSHSQGTPDFRIFHVMPGHTVTIQSLTISSGYLPFDNGGGILNEQSTATIADCSLTNNYTGNRGGAVYSDGSGGGAMLTVLNSTITGNTAGNEQHGGVGGGLYNYRGTLTISSSIISNNAAWIGNDFFGGDGGGIINDNGTLEISNTTIGSNLAGVSGGGHQ